MNMEELTNLCILLGTDYNDSVYGYGFVKSYKTIRESEDNGKEVVTELIPNYNEVRAEFEYEYKIGNGGLDVQLLQGFKQGAKFMLGIIKSKMNIQKINGMISDDTIIDICANIYSCL